MGAGEEGMWLLMDVKAMEGRCGLGPSEKDFLRLHRKSGELIFIMPGHIPFFFFLFSGNVLKKCSASTDAALGTG